MNSNKESKARSIRLILNILAGFIVKGWSAVVALAMVPLTLKCLGMYANGVWLTVSSLLVWVDQMDIGLGNGLRNSLAASMAHDDREESRRLVSSTFAILLCIVLPVCLLASLLVWTTDIYGFLNVSREIIPELRTALVSAIILVCITFVMKTIGNVYMGLQLPAVSNLIMALGQTVALAVTAWLYVNGNATFLTIVIVNTAAPLVVYALAYPVTFYGFYPWLRPSLKAVDLASALRLGNIGIRFFWLQIAALLQFMTANVLISKFFTPAMVTPYQISYRYLSIIMVAFTIICMPFWNATTDAYERGDMQWIINASRKMNILTAVLAILLVGMVVVSPMVYDLWIGQGCEVPMGMTVMMALYIFLLVLSMRYSYFLNGVGALRLQLYMTVMAVVFIPLAWFVSALSHDIIWFMGVLCFCNLPGIIVNIIQFNKIINGNAKGIWRI